MAEQRYRVIERLEAGGMAEVFVGEQAGAQGFKKRVAIKRVLPHLAQNKRFISMFLDEARLGARLTHANIVSTIDIGAADNTYFIVMELVDGANLKTIMESLRKQGRRFPVKEAVYICMEACRGLSYAHELEDDDGRPLGIVHRDISPPNIMITKRGEVKVMDFGLAKAATQLEKTDPGVVKGKFSYLSPEAALGQDVDARTDVFAMGIVLWEMIAGRRLFLGETDYQTVKLVQAAQVPSLMRINPEVDAALEQVIGKALARDVRQRFQSARELGDALAGYLFSHQMKVTAYDIANLVQDVVAEKKAAAPRQEQSIIDRLIQEELLRFTSLEDMSDPLAPGSAGLSPDDVDGAKPLTDLGGFENPAEWFSDDAEVAAAVGGAAARLPTTLGKGKGEPSGRWRELGADDEGGTDSLATMLEGATVVASLGPDGQPVMPDASAGRASQPSGRFSQPGGAPAGSSQPGRGQPGPGQPGQFTQPSAAQVPAHGAPRPLPMPEPEPMPARRGGSAALYVVIALLVLAGAGAAAWFAGVIPH
jgi:serine/threonine-protein kinase